MAPQALLYGENMKLTENKTEILRVRVTADMYDLFEKYAESNGMTLSKYIRLYLEFLYMQLESGGSVNAYKS